MRRPLDDCARRAFESMGFEQSDELPNGVLRFTHAGDVPGTLHELRSVRWGSDGVMAFATTYSSVGAQSQVQRIYVRLHDLRAATRRYRQMARQLRPAKYALRRIFDGAAARNVALRVLECLGIDALLRVATASRACHRSIVVGEGAPAVGARGGGGGGGAEHLEGNSPARLLWPRLFLRDWGETRAVCSAAEYCRHSASELAWRRGAEASGRRRARERLTLIEFAARHALRLDFIAIH